MTGMQHVLEQHRSWATTNPDEEWLVICFECQATLGTYDAIVKPEEDGERTTHELMDEAHAAHQAKMLTAAGFGDMREARAQALDEEAASFQAQSEAYLATSQTMAGSPDGTRDDIIRYGAYASGAQSAGLRLSRRATAIRSGE